MYSMLCTLVYVQHAIHLRGSHVPYLNGAIVGCAEHLSAVGLETRDTVKEEQSQPVELCCECQCQGGAML
jgi:hypothetical protein